MKDSKCYIALSFLDKKELKELDDFVQSPFFNKEKPVIRLYQWMKNHFDRTTRRPLTRRTAYIKVYPDKPIPKNSLNDKESYTLNIVLSKLTKLIFRFMEWKEKERNEAYSKHLLLQSFLTRNATELFRQHLSQVYPVSNASTKISPNTYHDQFLLEYDYSRWNLLQKNNIQKRDNLQAVSDNLTLYYLTRQFQLIFEMLSMRRTYKTSYNLDFLDALFEIAKLPQFNTSPLVQVYIVAAQMVKDEDTYHFEQFKQLLLLHNDSIDTKSKNDLYVLATNFCTRRVIAGKIEYLEELFLLYKTMSEKNLLVEGEYIPVDKMKNIISVGCKLEHFDWTQQLIEDSKERIAPRFRDSVYSFGLGLINFYKGNLNEAISHLIRVEDIDINYHLSGRFVMMKAYYDLDEDYSERTEQIFKSFIAYIKQNKVISSVNKEGYTNFTKTLVSLYRIKHFVGKRSLEVVENRLNSYARTSDKRWLLEKIGELKETTKLKRVV